MIVSVTVTVSVPLSTSLPAESHDARERPTHLPPLFEQLGTPNNLIIMSFLSTRLAEMVEKCLRSSSVPVELVPLQERALMAMVEAICSKDVSLASFSHEVDRFRSRFSEPKSLTKLFEETMPLRVKWDQLVYAQVVHPLAMHAKRRYFLLHLGKVCGLSATRLLLSAVRNDFLEMKRTWPNAEANIIALVLDLSTAGAVGRVQEVAEERMQIKTMRLLRARMDDVPDESDSESDSESEPETSVYELSEEEEEQWRRRRSIRDAYSHSDQSESELSEDDLVEDDQQPPRKKLCTELR